MTRKLLQGLGVVLVLGLIAASIGALSLSAQRVHVTIQPADAAVERGIDPVAVLGADLGELRTDVRALADANGPALEALHAALEQSAQERAQALEKTDAERARALELRLDALERALASTQSALQRGEQEARETRSALRAALAQLSASRLAPDAASASPAAPSADREIDGAGTATIPIAQAPRTTPESAPNSAPATASAESSPTNAAGSSAVVAPGAPGAPEAKKSFLAFKLPSSGFSFAGRQRLAIVPALSRVGFDAKSTLHDFSGVTSSVEGELVTDLAHPDAACGGNIRVRAASLDTGVADRDAEMRTRLAVAEHPELRFDWQSFEAREVDAAAMKLSGQARGVLTIRGVAREVAMPVTVSVDESKRVSIAGELRLRMSQFNVEAPSKLGLITVQDEVTLWIALRARSLGAAPAGAIPAGGAAKDGGKAGS